MEKQFEGIGGFQPMRPSLFGGRDHFFSRPFGSTTTSNPAPAPAPAPQMNRDKGVVIQELDSDDDDEESMGEDYVHHGSTKQPSVEHPDDHVNEERNVQDVNRAQGAKSKSQTFSLQTCRVTYGGVDGAYYTSTRTRRAGSDGTMLEESKEADTTTGQATHRISRGIHDKGHSVTRKLNTDGKVDTLQTLHNLNEDELARFEEAWVGNAQGHGHDWSAGYGIHGDKGTSTGEQGQLLRGGWMLPRMVQGGSVGGGGTNMTKKVVRINIE